MEKLSDSSLKIRPPHWYENLTKDEMSQPPLWKHRKDDNPTDQGNTSLTSHFPLFLSDKRRWGECWDSKLLQPTQQDFNKLGKI